MLCTQAFKLGAVVIVIIGVVAVSACGGNGGGGGGSGGAASSTAGPTTTSSSGKGSSSSSGKGSSSSSAATSSSSATASSSSSGGGFACAGVAPPMDGTITDFATVDAMGHWGMGAFAGGIFNYPAAITADDQGMALHATGMVADYSGFGMYFNVCTNASAFKGVQFDVKGDVGKSGMLTVSIQTNDTTPIDPVNMRGSCMFASPATKYTECVFPFVPVTVTAAGSTVTVMFADTTGGHPPDSADPKQLMGLQWAFGWTGPGDTPYAVDVTVDNVKFIP